MKGLLRLLTKPPILMILGILLLTAIIYYVGPLINLEGRQRTSVALLVGLLPMVPAQSPAIIAVVLLWGGISFAIYPVGLALLGQHFQGGDIARANTAFSMLYILGGLIGRPLTGAAMDAVGDPGLGWTLAVFYFAAAMAALLALRRPG